MRVKGNMHFSEKSELAMDKVNGNGPPGQDGASANPTGSAKAELTRGCVSSDGLARQGDPIQLLNPNSKTSDGQTKVEFHLERPAVLDSTSIKINPHCLTQASPESADLLTVTPTRTRNYFGANESDQESFIMEGMSIHNFRHSAISPDCSFRREFTRPERPPLRTTSELIREIEVEFELHKIEKDKNEQAQDADAELSCHEPLPLPKTPERVDSEVNFDPEVKDSSDSNANEEYESKSNENREFEAIAEVGENPKANEGEALPEAQSENDIGGYQVQIDEFAGGAVGGKKIEEDGEDKIATEMSKSQAVIGEQ